MSHREALKARNVQLPERGTTSQFGNVHNPANMSVGVDHCSILVSPKDCQQSHSPQVSPTAKPRISTPVKRILKSSLTWIQCQQSTIGTISATIPTNLANASIPRVSNGGNLTRGSACQQRKVLQTFWRCVAKMITSPLFQSQIHNQLFLCTVSSGPDLISLTRSCP